MRLSQGKKFYRDLHIFIWNLCSSLLIRRNTNLNVPLFG